MGRCRPARLRIAGSLVEPISGGGFEFDGRFHAVEPNVAGEALPIHGDGFQKPWRVAGKTATEIELILDHGSIGPYRYVASIVYELQDGSLNATLTVENRAADPLALRTRLPSLVPAARRHVAAGERRARLARRRAPSADGDGAGRRASGLGLFQRRFAARRLDQQWLRRMGRKRAHRPAGRRDCPFRAGIAVARRLHPLLALPRCRLLLLRTGVASGRRASRRRADGAGTGREHRGPRCGWIGGRSESP